MLIISKIFYFLEIIGDISLFMYEGIFKIKNAVFSTNKFIRSQIIEQFYSFGIKSFPLVAVVALFTGMVLTVQLIPAFNKFDAASLTGGAIGLSIVRELGPTLTGIIMAGRIVSSITAEIGSMKITEQIDALDVMAIDPMTYLVSPKILAGIIMLPILTVFADVIGIFGAFVIGTSFMNIPTGTFISNLAYMVTPHDVFAGLFKSVFFGLILAVVATYKGMNVKVGSEGLGKNTTSAVVTSIVLILIVNFFISAFLFT